mgnify:CR=1 FL=1
MNSMMLPKFPLGRSIEWLIDFFVKHFSGFTNALSEIVESMIGLFTQLLNSSPPPLTIILFGILAWALTKRTGVTVFTVVGLFFVWNLRLWGVTMETISLVIVSTMVAIMLGIPLGILAALYRPFHHVITPILDFMQTLPAFVYLIPAIPFFGLGVTSAVFSTVIFAMPPAIRLTDLGIRQVPGELVEAADAFGSTKMQKLFKLQLPLAAVSIRAGVNQTIMLALSMVVIASMIGAGGLGGVVWKAIQRLKPGMGFEAGISIVILAIILDRMLQGQRKKKTA